MANATLDIVYEDNHLLAVVKPAGLLVQGDRTGDPTLLDAGKAYLKERYGKPGNVYLGLVHRLDRPVSGVVLLARTSKAAGRLSRQFREGTPRKTYLAVVTGTPEPAAGELRHWMGAAADAEGRTPIAAQPFAGGKEAILRYRVVEPREGRSLVEVELITGRRHQIRAQMAAAGHPILGDRKYGSTEKLPARRVALHARSLEVEHPVGGLPVLLEAEPPDDWPWPRPGNRKEEP